MIIQCIIEDGQIRIFPTASSGRDGHFVTNDWVLLETPHVKTILII